MSIHDDTAEEFTTIKDNAVWHDGKGKKVRHPPNNIAKLREDRGLTQEQLHAKCGFPEGANYISNYEARKDKRLNTDVIFTIAKALDVDPGLILLQSEDLTLAIKSAGLGRFASKAADEQRLMAIAIEAMKKARQG